MDCESGRREANQKEIAQNATIKFTNSKTDFIYQSETNNKETASMIAFGIL